jgi:hypothetical protein
MRCAPMSLHRNSEVVVVVLRVTDDNPAATLPADSIYTCKVESHFTTRTTAGAVNAAVQEPV